LLENKAEKAFWAALAWKPSSPTSTQIPLNAKTPASADVESMGLSGAFRYETNFQMVARSATSSNITTDCSVAVCHYHFWLRCKFIFAAHSVGFFGFA